MAVAASELRAGRVLTRLLAALALTLGLVGLAPAPASQAAGCTVSTGVSIVVQYPDGSTRTGCAPGSYSTALQAMNAAGFTTTRAAREVGYFVCKINGLPASEPCQKASPVNAYWALFHGRPGTGWTYSQLGAASLPAPQGSSIGWRFGAGAAPSTPPITPRPPATSTSTAPKPSSTRATATRSSSTSTRASSTSSRATAGTSSSAPRSTSAGAPASTSGGSSSTSAAKGGSSSASTNGSSTNGSSSSGKSSAATSTAGKSTAGKSSAGTSTAASSASNSTVASSSAASGSGDATNVAAEPKQDNGGSGGGTNLGLIAGGGAAALLGAGAIVASVRRRPQE